VQVDHVTMFRCGKDFGWFGAAGLALAVVGPISWIVGEWNRIHDVAYSVTLIVRHQRPASLTVVGVAVAMAAATTSAPHRVSRQTSYRELSDLGRLSLTSSVHKDSETFTP
jgi:uncharacterized membrane protein YeiB